MSNRDFPVETVLRPYVNEDWTRTENRRLESGRPDCGRAFGKAPSFRRVPRTPNPLSPAGKAGGRSPGGSENGRPTTEPTILEYR
ncbi:hypothetical protein GCM10010430_62380 [Kitasatospora cystarginea]|uniref:Uncharacterized protein n=1 Tax=Kitasatospora cystarginea TaxID=58350 RepID=A0ABP5RN87_9ACTN